MKNLIFDFDGVLANSFAAIAYAEEKLYKLSSSTEAENRLHEFFQTNPDDVPTYGTTNTSDQEQLTEAKHFTQYINDYGFDLFPNVIAEIKAITDARLAIVSTNMLSLITEHVTPTGLNFSHILGYEESESKIQKITQVCRDWNISLDDAYYLTDTLRDVYELRNLLPEDKLIGVAWGFCGAEVLAEELKPEYILQKPADIHTLFRD